MDWCLRSGHSKWTSKDKPPWTIGLQQSSANTTLFHSLDDKSQLFSFLGGAVMLLVYEYSYSWLQENW